MKRIWVELALCAVNGTVASAADPFVGTYKLNPAKSKMSGGEMASTLTLVIAEDCDHLILTRNGSNADGSAIASKLAVPKKGGDARVLEVTPAHYLASVSRPSANTVQIVTML